MAYIGKNPTSVPLTSSDLADSIVTSAKIVDGTIASADLATGVGGKVLQVVTATDSSQRTTTSTSFVTASNTLSLSITPSSASNKIFLIASLNGSSSADYYALYTIYRNSTNISPISSTEGFMKTAATSGSRASCTFSVLDSPSLTSAITYQIYFRTEGGSNSARINIDTSTSTLTAFEIAG